MSTTPAAAAKQSFLQRKNIVFSLHRYGIEALDAHPTADASRVINFHQTGSPHLLDMLHLGVANGGWRVPADFDLNFTINDNHGHSGNIAGFNRFQRIRAN